MENLEDDDCLRQRLDPRPGDPVFLHLLDLRAALEPLRTDAAIEVLDYGCGGSPYRSLFPNAAYKRADYAGVSGVDLILTEDSLLRDVPNAFLIWCSRLKFWSTCRTLLAIWRRRIGC